MVNFIDKMVGLNVIIAAGYPEEMKERFMKANQGMPRRFPYVLNLQPYQPNELTKILLSHFNKANPNLIITKDDANYLYTIIKNLEDTYHNMDPDRDPTGEEEKAESLFSQSRR